METTAYSLCDDENAQANEKEPVLANKDNKYIGESVPNYKSTNCDTDLVVDRVQNTDPQSSISNVDSVLNNETDGRIADQSNPTTVTVTTCISTVSTLLANELKENHFKNFNFDNTEASNVSEKTPKVIDKSSILDTVYSKYHNSLLSERPNVVNVNDSVKTNTEHVVSDVIVEKKTCAESGSGKYVCTYCNLACSKPSVLQKHIRAHTNERPYPCISCGFSFKTRSNLYKHCRSRTHANRVMGNKHVQGSSMECMDVDSSSEKNDDRLESVDEGMEEKNERIATPIEFTENVNNFNDKMALLDQRTIWEQKSKPYKPKFHTAKLFFEENKIKETSDISKVDVSKSFSSTVAVDNIKNKTDESSDTILQVKTNPDLLKLRINELINKNNSIVNCDDAIVIRRRSIIENGYSETVNNSELSPSHHIYWQQSASDYNRSVVEEPLNLTSKNRKRCLSDSDNSQKSLIKELLLNNLSAEPNLQCQYCRNSFQTVPELEMHKLKYCSAYSKGNNIRYARSSSVNVASILTHNKSALDNMPQIQNTAFSLKSPGPFLGKTRLIENDKQSEKYRTFSFDDNAILHHTQPESPSFNKYILHSPAYPLSPQVKKNPVKLFGGEVKITQTSGETRSFKIESESMNKMSEDPQNYMDFGTKISENLVIKSSLHSGGTVLQNKANYNPKIDSLPSPNIIKIYDNTNIVSPSLNLNLLNEKNKFTYDKVQQSVPQQNDRLLTIGSRDNLFSKNTNEREGNFIENSGKYETEKDLFKSNLIDFSQKVVKLITPNLKHPNLGIPGIPVPSLGDKIYSPIDITVDSSRDKQTLDNINFAKKQISLQQKMSENQSSQNIYNPVNLLVNGKVIRYVPGMPGPVADAPSDINFSSIISNSVRSSKEPLNSPRPLEDTSTNVTYCHSLNGNKFEIKTPCIIVDQHENRHENNQNYSSKTKMEHRKDSDKILENKITPLSISVTSPEKITKEEARKFARPNSLALKPSSVAFKSHHGLTPTMFNQALISPDTPRVAKKYCQQYLNGNYFSYLGLKSSTKSVYCTLNKTQPFYVKHFKKLSMYSEWRQQESKIDSLSVSAYDSRQRQTKYTMAGQSRADLIVHSSYKFVHTEPSTPKDEISKDKNSSVLGGYESNEDYTYIRGRGRGRYVCDQCGIRCKKPSMLKKHIRTHSDDRPYTCQHCNFSFKTKGNLTKHMKSKAHSKKYAETSSTSTQNSITSSESEDSDADSSDESTRLQEHEAAHCLLSLSQKNTSVLPSSSTYENNFSTSSNISLTEFPNFLKDDKFLKNPDQITQVTNTNFAKNKIMDENVHFSASKHITTEILDSHNTNSNQDLNNVSQFLGRSSTVRPLTYPYLQTQFEVQENEKSFENIDSRSMESTEYIPKPTKNQVIKETYPPEVLSPRQIGKSIIDNKMIIKENVFKKSEETVLKQVLVSGISNRNDYNQQNVEGNLPANIVFRKRKLSTNNNMQYKIQRNEEGYKPMDLTSIPVVKDSPVLDLSSPASNNSESVSFVGALTRKEERVLIYSPHSFVEAESNGAKELTPSTDILLVQNSGDRPLEQFTNFTLEKPRTSSFSESNSSETFSQSSDINERILKTQDESPLSVDNPNVIYKPSSFGEGPTNHLKEFTEHDQSAMQTLAEIAIKQMKTEKNIMAKSVASEYLKLALKNEYNTSCDGNTSDGGLKKYVSSNKESGELIVKPEENKNCSICSKNFNKPSQLRLHMNIHYLERPFRCESCSVSFRTKGHLQKHERSASHHNKLSSSPALSSSEPRPFKCSDCNIAFRIHGHLAKHLRSKMHIMKLECLAKIPFGLYAELERANSLLTEINTTDGDLCLESLKILARKLFSNDPNKLDQLAAIPETRDS